VTLHGGEPTLIGVARTKAFFDAARAGLEGVADVRCRDLLGLFGQLRRLLDVDHHETHARREARAALASASCGGV
jgi:hypothetical protein